MDALSIIAIIAVSILSIMNVILLVIFFSKIIKEGNHREYVFDDTGDWAEDLM